MGAQQIQRSTLAEKLRQQHFEASGEDIGADIEPRFIGNTRPRHRPQPYDVGVITEAIATDRQADFALAVMKTPMVMHAAAEHVQQAIVLRQLFELTRLAVARQVGRRGAEHAAIVRGDGQGHQTRIFRFAVAQGDVHRLAEQVGDTVTEQQAHGQLRVLALKLVETAITAWELLFERLQIREGKTDEGQSLLIVGAAGGVGSILTQLARQLTGLKVIGTASRAQTRDWVTELGADLVIDHSQPLSEELQRAGIDHVTHVASLTQTDLHLDQLVEALAPQGKLALIDDPKSLDVSKLKRKSLSLHWEFMYTRSLFETPDMIEQHKLLNRVAELIDAGTLKTTVGEHFGTINAANLRRAHELLESGKAKGKIVLESF